MNGVGQQRKAGEEAIIDIISNFPKVIWYIQQKMSANPIVDLEKSFTK